MKLATNNIKFVRMIAKDGVPYNWVVVLKGINNARMYCNYNEQGRTTSEEYKSEWLPKSVQKFIEKASEELESINEWKESEYQHFIYK